MTDRTRIGIAHVTYYLPPRVRDLAEWGRRTGQRAQHLEQLARAGAQCYHDAAGEPAFSMARRALSALLDETSLQPAQVDCLIYTHALQSSVAPPPLSLPRLLCAQCGLTQAETFSFSQQNCASLLGALRIVRAMFEARATLERVVLMGADAMPFEAGRSVHGDGLMGDGACAALITRDSPVNRLIALATRSRGYDWRGMLAPGEAQRASQALLDARALARQVCAEAAIRPQDVGLVLPHHLNLPRWQQLLAELDIPRARLYADNFSRIAHVTVSDTLINLRDSRERTEDALPGTGLRLLLASGVGGFCAAALLAPAGWPAAYPSCHAGSHNLR